MENFSLDIDIGNEGMSQVEDVAGTLREVADTLDGPGGASGPIIDRNGNRVGGWAFDQLADKRSDPETLLTEGIAGTLEGCAEGFRENPEDLWTGREVADLLEAAKAAAPGAAKAAMKGSN